MGKSLVIVESPAKARTINKYLGKDFVVKSSVGHIRDLPVHGSGREAQRGQKKQAGKKQDSTPAAKAARAQAALVRRMGVDPEHGWEARYQILPGKEKVLTELKKLAADADMVYLATDLDREGEAIAWHLREVIGGDQDRYRRVTFSEITKKAIQDAFAEPDDINIDRVNAQQARRFLDRVVGFMLSPLLWQKVARGLSAGRVQSVATRLVVEREREIRAFTPEEYWEVHADLLREDDQLRAQVAQHRGENFRPGNREEIDRAVDELEAAEYRVAEREDKPTRQKPPPPFITSTLQQAASTRLNFSVKKTMTLAQRLYEAGLITYMRTDSRNLSGDAVIACRTFIGKQYGEQYLPEKPNIYASGQGAQEAHEAIRPTDVRLEPDEADKLERDQQRLYELIWRQFVACQMPPATFDTTVVQIAATRGVRGAEPPDESAKAATMATRVAAADYTLRARGRVMRFDGWMQALPPASRRGDDDVQLPDLAVGEVLRLGKLEPSQHFTKPPARFTEASLVKELEKKGIGRPSTYASIISTIQDRGYVSLNQRRLYAEKMGEIVTDRLVENFSALLDYGFTAALEEDLDEIAEGEERWREVLDRFYADFKTKLEKAEARMRGNEPTVIEEVECPECGRPMALRTARTGVFLSCTGYQLSKKEGRCTATLNLVPGEESETVRISRNDDDMELNELRAKRRCPLCSAAMDSYLLDEKRRLHVCGNNPDCPGHEIQRGEFRIKGYEGPVIECDKCGEDMQLRSGRFGKYFACSSKDCKNTRKLLKSGEPAPPKMDPVPMPELACEKADDHYLLRDGARGVFLAASKYPKVRETRNPTVAELTAHRDELPEKHRYLADAPEADPDGRPAIIRFSRKSNQQYVASERDDGKPSGWSAYYENGQWVEKGEDKVAAKSVGKKKPKKRKSATKKPSGTPKG